MIIIFEIKVIPASAHRNSDNKNEAIKRRVAFYARVSTDKDGQMNSLRNQVEYYQGLVSKREDWIFVGMYYDEGKSATSTKKRTGFNELIHDALSGKIDLIVTKSVTRFARNTIDAISSVRMLKEHGVEVFFEKDNIWTLSSDSEFVLTIISAIAQEESHSISENTKWGMRKNMQKGIGCITLSQFLGYKRGPEGQYVIDEMEAKIVKYIYDSFVSGMSLNDICVFLELNNIKTPTGKTKWNSASVYSILSNEKYKGDCLLQKYFVPDFMKKKIQKNTGELPQYYVKNHHPAIIDRNVWDKAHKELGRIKPGFKTLVKEGFYRRMIRCECCDKKCGGYYGPKVAHSNSKHRSIFYRCDKRYKYKCKSPTIKEAVLNLIIFDCMSDYKNIDVSVSLTEINKSIDKIVVSSVTKMEVFFSDGTSVNVDYEHYYSDERLRSSYGLIKTTQI